MEWTKIQVLIGTVDYTSWLANQEQVATLPDGSEIGRASFTLLDDGTMPAISEWSSITLKGGGTAATVNLWAGYVTRQQSEPFSFTAGAKRVVTLDCQSAAIRLLTTEPITRVYGGGDLESITTDRDIVADLVQTYAPSLYNIAKIGTADQVQVDYIGFRQESLRSALNKVAERTGRTFGVDAVPEFWYRQGTEAGYGSSYDYKLSDEDFEDENPVLPMSVAPVYDRDATELRNSVRVLGGATLSTVQAETFAGDDVTTVFQVDYYPSVVISVEVGGLPQTVGIMYVDDPADFDCLVEYDRRQFHFDEAPPTGKNVVIQYRYGTQVDVTVTDAASIAAVGTIWAPVLEDASVSSASQGSALGSAYLASTQAVTRATVTTRHGGTAGTALPWEPARMVSVTTSAFGWTNELLRIRGVTVRAQPRPGGDGSGLIIWDLDLGSGPASAGRTFGGQWNNTEVKAQQHAPEGIERLAEADGGGVTDHGALTGLIDDDHTQYLLATGARTGASSQAQTFTNGIIGPTWKPASDSTTALQMQNAAGTAILTVDTTNKWVGIGTTPTSRLHVKAAETYALVELQNTTAWNGAAFSLSVVGYTNLGGFRINGADADNSFYSTSSFGFTANSGQVMKWSHWTGAVNTRFYIDGNGLVGIGTTAPDSQLHVHLDDAATNAASQLLTLSHNTSNTAANGFGSRVLFELESSTTADQTAAALDVAWTDATHATRTGQLTLHGSYAGTLYEAVRAGAVSGAAALGFYGVTAIARPTTSSGAASFTANSGTAVNDASTFDGYTLKQVVKALRDVGLLT